MLAGLRGHPLDGAALDDVAYALLRAAIEEAGGYAKLAQATAADAPDLT